MTPQVFWGRRRALRSGAALCALIGAFFAVLVVASWSAGAHVASGVCALFVVIGVAGTVSLGRGWMAARRGPLLVVDEHGVTWRGRTIAWSHVGAVTVAREIDPRAGYRVNSGIVLVDSAGGDGWRMRIESGQLADVDSAAAVAAAIEEGRADFGR